MMTQILRDSLGGNCKTKMIATMSADKEDIYESMSTCRFAKRVSKIQNLVSRNEQVDPGVIIQRLKKEVAELKAEISLLKGENVKESLTSEDVERCNKMVEEFIESTDPSKNIILADRLLINQCFYHFKHIFKDMQKRKGGAAAGGSSAVVQQSPTKEDSMQVKNLGDEVQRLQILVQQRDNEIGILLNYLNKKKGDEALVGVGVQRTPGQEESKTGGPTLFQMMKTGQSAAPEKKYDIIQTGVNENPLDKKRQMDREV